MSATRLFFKELKRGYKFRGISYVIRRLLREFYLYRKYEDIKYWFLYRTTRKYNQVKLDLEHGYYDIDTRLIHANFCLLCEFIEKEKPFEFINWDADEEHKHAAKEMKELYHWWKNVYPYYNDHDPINGVEAPKREFKVYKRDEDGDPQYYIWEIVKGEEEKDEKFRKACKLSFEYEKKVHQEIEDNLIRLIKIRSFLWT